MSRLPIDAAYEAAGNALDRACETCGVPIGQWCHHPDGRLGRVPHVSRCGRVDLVHGDGHPALSNRKYVSDFVDYSEPRHKQEMA